MRLLASAFEAAGSVPGTRRARHPAWLPARFASNPNSVCSGSVPGHLSMRLLASAFEAAGSVPGTRRGCLRDLLSIPTQFARSLLGVCPHAFVQVSCLALMNAVLLYQQQRNARICDSIKGFPF
jgi:hypothetical protein